MLLGMAMTVAMAMALAMAPSNCYRILLCLLLWHLLWLLVIATGYYYCHGDGYWYVNLRFLVATTWAMAVALAIAMAGGN